MAGGIDNLTPVKKGQVLNPKGKPKGTKNRATIVRELLEALHESGRPNVEVMTAEIVKKALKGDLMAWEKLLDSGYGKIADKTELTGKDGEEFKGITVSFAKPNDPA